MAFKSHRVVDCLMAQQQDVRVAGFRKSILSQVSNESAVSEAAKGFVPDAYAILQDNREVHGIEVVDTCPITFDKAARLYEFGECLRDIDWSFSVVAFDYTGGLICHLPSWCFCPAYTDKFKGQEMRDVLPAAMAVLRDTGVTSDDRYGEPRWSPALSN